MREKEILTEDLGLPFRPSSGTSYLVLHAQESGGPDDSYVEFLATFPKENHHLENIRINFKRFLGGRVQGMFELLSGIGIIKNSAWLAELNRLQLEKFHDYPDNFKDFKHYYFTGHDAVVEVLAEELTWKSLGEVK